MVGGGRYKENDMNSCPCCELFERYMDYFGGGCSKFDKELEVHGHFRDAKYDKWRTKDMDSDIEKAYKENPDAKYGCFCVLCGELLCTQCA